MSVTPYDVMCDRQPYLYAIGWSELNVWYIGVAYRQGCSPLDLWTRYFTSSNIVRDLRNDYGEPDHCEILAVGTAAEVIELEFYALCQLGIVKDSRWLNRAAWGRAFMNHQRSPKSKAMQSQRLRQEAPRYEYQGQMLTMMEICAATGIKRATLWHRMMKIGMTADEAAVFDGNKSASEKKRKGWANDDARRRASSDRATQRHSNYLHNGRYYTTAELGEMCGVSSATMWSRLVKQGKTIEEALAMPAGRRRSDG